MGKYHLLSEHAQRLGGHTSSDRDAEILSITVSADRQQRSLTSCALRCSIFCICSCKCTTESANHSVVQTVSRLDLCRQSTSRQLPSTSPPRSARTPQQSPGGRGRPHRTHGGRTYETSPRGRKSLWGSPLPPPRGASPLPGGPLLHPGGSLMPQGGHLGSHLAASQAQAVANVEFLKRQLEARSHLVQAQVQIRLSCMAQMMLGECRCGLKVR